MTEKNWLDTVERKRVKITADIPKELGEHDVLYVMWVPKDKDRKIIDMVKIRIERIEDIESWEGR